jgi:hypothetical protein
VGNSVGCGWGRKDGGGLCIYVVRFGNDGNEYRIMLDYTEIPNDLECCEVLSADIKWKSKNRESFNFRTASG